MKVCSLSYMDSIKVCPVMSDLFQCVYYYVESISIDISIRNRAYQLTLLIVKIYPSQF